LGLGIELKIMYIVAALGSIVVADIKNEIIIAEVSSNLETRKFIQIEWTESSNEPLSREVK